MMHILTKVPVISFVAGYFFRRGLCPHKPLFYLQQNKFSDKKICPTFRKSHILVATNAKILPTKMDETTILPQWKYYIFSIILGSILNLILLIIILGFLGFGGRDIISIIYISTSGYFYKSVIFFTPFLFLNSDFYEQSANNKRLIYFLPVFLFALWFILIITFQIDSFSHEISYGYFGQFPHFYVQLMATFAICIFIKNRANNRILGKYDSDDD